MKIVSVRKRRRVRGPYLNDGGAPALNFINTCKKDSKGRYMNLLSSYSSFLNWCEQCKLIDYDCWFELDAEQYCYAHEAELIYSDVITARNCFDELFNNLLKGEEIHPLIMERFNGYAEKIKPHLHYEPSAHGPELYWRNTTEEMNLPLWLVIASACKLIDSGEWRKIKKCPVCGSLFLDYSRARNRRWCNPNTCGSLRKSEGYYKRKIAVKMA